MSLSYSRPVDGLARPRRGAGIPRADPTFIRNHPERVFILSDTHWGLERDESPRRKLRKHTRAIIDNWTQALHEQDVVLHLGDVATSAQCLRELLRSEVLPGQVFLLPGNHDDQCSIELLRAHGWAVLDPFVLEYQGSQFAFTHEPMAPQALPRHTINVHGHIHSGLRVGPRHLNVCVPLIGYAPTPLLVLLDEIHCE